ncbi:unnamed protein product, partial [marine sediment metagenome]
MIHGEMVGTGNKIETEQGKMQEEIEKTSQTQPLSITRLSSGKMYVEKDWIIKEIPFTILVNGQEIATLLCSPDKLEYLAVGFLLSEGL